MNGPIKLGFTKKTLEVVIENPYGPKDAQYVVVKDSGNTKIDCYVNVIRDLYELGRSIDKAINQVRKDFNPDHCGLSHHITCTCKGEGGDR